MIQEFSEILVRIDEQILSTKTEDIPELFKEIPLQLFGELLLQEQNIFLNIKTFFPKMVSEELQLHWNGAHGYELLDQSVAIIKSIVDFYQARKNIDDLSKLNILDFGCGWGRLIRLLYKYIPDTQIYGVDAWEKPLIKCREYDVRANFGKIDDHCKTIPFDVKFDIVYAFSIFTHLSKRASDCALNSIRKSIKDDGILVLTVRQFDYWSIHVSNWNKDLSVNSLIKDHLTKGFAYVPSKREQVDGEVAYGDTSISIEYIQDNWIDWKIIDYKINLQDPYQPVVFLRPV